MHILSFHHTPSCPNLQMASPSDTMPARTHYNLHSHTPCSSQSQLPQSGAFSFFIWTEHFPVHFLVQERSKAFSNLFHHSPRDPMQLYGSSELWTSVHLIFLLFDLCLAYLVLFLHSLRNPWGLLSLPTFLLLRHVF